MNKIKILKKPLTLRALKARADKNSRISVNITVDLGDILDDFGGIDGLNGYADEKILHESIGSSLSDISYKVVGHVSGKYDGTVTGSTIINVNADVSDIFNDNNIPLYGR
jgi:hypothetical protein